MTEVLDQDSKEWQAALARATKMKTCIPDAMVRGRGRVRDLTAEDIARWILHDQGKRIAFNGSC